ncbi:hypothetical protein ACFQXB_05920 [Plastorhodobacter daqingensis]|uniref:Methyl-accepting chemotaxis protein n=1 Tax=Plastorhodobacter daqingensis TaxID=1387281 RepID=A0ABW2UKC7_9RHOB
MSSKTQAIETSIQLALDAADAATDVTHEFNRIKNDFSRLGARMEQVQRMASFVLAGALVGLVLAMGMGGLIYFRSLTELRTMTATSVENLVLLTDTMDRLEQVLEPGESLTALVEDLAARNEGLAEMLARIEAQVAEATTELAANAAQDSPAAALDPQMVSALYRHIDDGLARQLGEIGTLIADLQLATSKMLAPLGGGVQIEEMLNSLLRQQAELTARLAPAAAGAGRAAQPAARPAARSPQRPAAVIDNPLQYP